MPCTTCAAARCKPRSCSVWDKHMDLRRNFKLAVSFMHQGIPSRPLYSFIISPYRIMAYTHWTLSRGCTFYAAWSLPAFFWCTSNAYVWQHSAVAWTVQAQIIIISGPHEWTGPRGHAWPRTSNCSYLAAPMDWSSQHARGKVFKPSINACPYRVTVVSLSCIPCCTSTAATRVLIQAVG